MLAEFWKSASGKVVDRGAELGTAVVFWAGLLAVWLWAHGGWSVVDGSQWPALSDVALLLVLIGVLLLAAAPSVLVARATQPTLRLLEGYWPVALQPLWTRRVASQSERLEQDQARYIELDQARKAADEAIEQAAKAAQLAASQISKAAPEEREQAKQTAREAAERAQKTRDAQGGFPRRSRDELAQLDWAVFRRPPPGRVMPTRVGNVLRAAEDWPRDRYGLDPIITWPRLWLLLPDSTRQEMARARSSMDSSASAVLWGLLFAAAAPLAALVGQPTDPVLPGLLGVLVGVGVALAASVWWLPNRAEVFADLLDSAYDLHRFALYEQMRWPLPPDPVSEKAAGEALTKYIWRGAHAAAATFAHPRQGASEDDGHQS